ncbi:MAG: ATP-binding cassette domain-containing protein, partial [Bacteroidales bacterium]|nr:ATP-binding cassette domain-containing protein [Bacteroidales bacterium]
MISVEGLSVEFGGTKLFDNISFAINEKDKIALMGKNGAGKSTLLKIIAGVKTPNKGGVTAPADSVIAYLPQHLMTEDGKSVYEETSMAFSHIQAMESRIEELNTLLGQREDYDSPEYYSLIEELSVLSEKLYTIESVNYREEIEKVLTGLGFMRSDLDRQTSEFSGGWRMRIELAKILLKKPNLILLDEPTNHLDMDSIMWLEEFLLNQAKAVIVISHDKSFVD